MSRAVVIACFVLSLASPVRSQTVSGASGAITGTVADSTKAVLAGVTVTLSGPAVMGTPVAVTDQNGGYRFAALSPGEYSLTFELSGFGKVTRAGIVVSLGFTALVNIEMNLGSVAETVTVSGASPVVDLQSTNVTTHFDSERLASLPGSRDFWAVLAQTPAVAMTRMDVGGSGALTQQPYTVYGITSSAGVNRAVVEGIVVNEGGGGGGSEMYYTDYGSFAEIAVNAVGNTAEMPSPGVLSQFISKSGGNAYHGNVYFDYENDSMEAHNIDDQQIAAGVQGSDVLDARDTNRLSELKDFNVDVGGFIKKDKLWWYGAYRRTITAQRYPTLIDDVQDTWVPAFTAKVTGNINPNHKVIGYYQHTNKEQPDYLGAVTIGGGRNTTAIMPADTVWHSGFPVHVSKVEYAAVLTNALLLELRGGNYQSVWWRTGAAGPRADPAKSTGPRLEDVGNNFVSGGNFSTDLQHYRPQANGALSYSTTRWGGSHNFKFGFEIMRETLEQPFYGFPHATNAVHNFNNGVATQVRLYQSPTVAKNGIWSQAGYVNDTWQAHKRLTLSLGLRLDRQQTFLPEQQGPDGQNYPAVDSVYVWKNLGPRLGVTYDVTGDAKTVVKFNYAQYWLTPSAEGGTDVSPNPPQWYRLYAWTDPNGNRLFDPGEQGRLISVQGGTATTSLDPSLDDTYTRQVTTYFEREVARNFAVRTGFVWNGRRQVFGQVNANRPLSAYTVPFAVRDPGPDGRTGTTDDGGTVTAFNLSDAYLALPPVNIVRNLEATESDYYTWEITATRREFNGWALLASFAETWSRATNLGTGVNFTPNQLINTDDGRNKTKTWQAKVHATLNLKWNLRATPIVRHQSGTPFGRTFVSTLNYGTATILAEPLNAQRTPNVTVFDVRTEKALLLKTSRLIGFFDVYNIFNTNKEQALSVSSGSSWLRPTAITPPRIARVGVKFVW
jgi:hypothetical protein